MLFCLFILVLTIRNAVGIRCWECNARSHLECFIYGFDRECPGQDDVCFYEQRERRGKIISIRQGCQQDRACQNQWKQNVGPVKARASCRPEGFLRWPSSVCNQCFYTDLCGHLWTPAGRTEWAMDTREHTEMSYTFVIVAGDD